MYRYIKHNQWLLLCLAYMCSVTRNFRKIDLEGPYHIYIYLYIYIYLNRHFIYTCQNSSSQLLIIMFPACMKHEISSKSMYSHHLFGTFLFVSCCVYVDCFLYI